MTWTTEKFHVVELRKSKSDDMGMCDNITIEYELSVPNLPKEGWQTKCFDCMSDTFILTSEGRLLQKIWAVNFYDNEIHEPKEQKLIDRNYEGVFTFYTAHDGWWYEFEVIMIDGNVKRIKGKPRTALPKQPIPLLCDCDKD